MDNSIDNKAFDSMNYATADKTAVNLMGDKAEVTREDIHNMLMVAGFTPALGNIADAIDAVLYAAEGEYGSAALSAAAMIPFIGQTVSIKRALKVAKESGEEMVTLYRGVDQWYPGKMVKKGKFTGGGEYVGKENWTRSTGTLPEETLWTTQSKYTAASYGRRGKMMKRDPLEGSLVLEFEVPKSYLDKFASSPYEARLGSKKVSEWLEDDSYNFVFRDGLPKEFLIKVHK